jgi:hypothetical protein
VNEIRLKCKALYDRNVIKEIFCERYYSHECNKIYEPQEYSWNPISNQFNFLLLIRKQKDKNWNIV